MGFSASSNDVTRLLSSHVTGDAPATSELFQVVYKRLKKLAAHYMKAERRGHTLQPTAVVHEAYLRLLEISQRTVKGDWKMSRTWLARELYRSAAGVRS